MNKARQQFLDSIKPRPYLERNTYTFADKLEAVTEVGMTLCPGFTLGRNNTEIYHESIKYFMGDPSCKYDLNKGIYLYGPTGTGKTLFFKIWHILLTKAYKNTGNSFASVDIHRLTQLAASSGIKVFDSTVYYFENRSKHFHVDDLGLSADIVSFFGTSIRVVNELIQRRYIEYSNDSALTHISTNLKPESLEERYGPALSSRAKEMFNFIPLAGPDYRQKK